MKKSINKTVNDNFYLKSRKYVMLTSFVYLMGIAIAILFSKTGFSDELGNSVDILFSIFAFILIVIALVNGIKSYSRKEEVTNSNLFSLFAVIVVFGMFICYATLELLNIV